MNMEISNDKYANGSQNGDGSIVLENHIKPKNKYFQYCHNNIETNKNMSLEKIAAARSCAVDQKQTKCKREFSKPSNITQHPNKALKTKDKFIVCGSSFSHMSELLAAKREHYKTSGGSLCSECGIQFSKRSNMVRHFKIEHLKIKDKRCHICDWASSRWSDLIQHVNFHYKLQFKTEFKREKCKDYKCDACDMAFSVKSSLIYHVEEVHEKIRNEICDICGYSAYSKTNIKLHKKRCHEHEGEAKCTQCNFQVQFTGFRRKVVMTNHLVSCHGIAKPFGCQLCNASYLSLSALKTHNKSKHSKVPQYVCNICGQIFSYNMCLKQHMEHEHKDINVRKSKLRNCQHCKCTYEDKYSLNMFMTKYKKSPSCNICDRVCRTKYTLCKHMKYAHLIDDKHSNKSVPKFSMQDGNTNYFRCGRCHAVYTSMLGLNVHITSRHSGSANYVLCVCGNNYLYKVSLLKR